MGGAWIFGASMRRSGTLRPYRCRNTLNRGRDALSKILMSGNRSILLFLIPAILVLTGAAGVQLWDATFHPVVVTKQAPLEEMIPREIPGWTCEDLPLAQTEEVKGRVLDRLDLNDYISRTYRRGEVEVILYVAYWKPLQMPVRQVGSHTPDVCWVLNGWECTEIENNVFIPFGDGVLKSAEKRVLEVPKHRLKQHVVYWHLIDGKVFKATNQVGMWDRWNMLTDHFRFGLNQKPEQYFIRLSANVPLDQVWENPGISELLEHLVAALKLKVPEGDDPEEWTYEFVI